MPLYADSETPAKVGDMVVGKPYYTQEEQCGMLIALRDTEHENAVVAYVDRLDLDLMKKRKMQPFDEQHIVAIRPFETSPTMFLRIRFDRCETKMLNRTSGPLNDILIDDREYRVPFRMNVGALLALAGRDDRFVLWRKSDGGIQDVRTEAGATIEVRSGMEFYTTREP